MDGSRLGDLDVGECIGRGGMAVVYRGWDRRLRRSVAVKVPSSDASAELLVHEAQAMAAFQHRGLPTIYQISDSELGVPYIVMELLRGRTLASHLEQAGGALRWDECCELLLGICDVLGVLHRADLAHRDLKPDNVMLCAAARTVLLDLGITAHEREIANEGRITGSPCYLAPEAIAADVALGEANLLDIYSLGILAFEMLTGTVPYNAETITELLNLQLAAPLPAFGALHPDIPPELEALVLSMMAKAPSERPQEVETIAATLRRALLGANRVGGKAVSVIVADDDPLLRELVAETIRALFDDVDVREAGDGDEALALYRESAADLLILDLDMPKQNGVEVCMHLQGLRAMKETTIGILSAHARGPERAFLSELGVDAFIDKQTTVGEALEVALSGLVGRVRRRRLALPRSASR